MGRGSGGGGRSVNSRSNGQTERDATAASKSAVKAKTAKEPNKARKASVPDEVKLQRLRDVYNTDNNDMGFKGRHIMKRIKELKNKLGINTYDY